MRCVQECDTLQRLEEVLEEDVGVVLRLQDRLLAHEAPHTMDDEYERPGNRTLLPRARKVVQQITRVVDETVPRRNTALDYVGVVAKREEAGAGQLRGEEDLRPGHPFAAGRPGLVAATGEAVEKADGSVSAPAESGCCGLPPVDPAVGSGIADSGLGFLWKNFKFTVSTYAFTKSKKRCSRTFCQDKYEGAAEGMERPSTRTRGINCHTGKNGAPWANRSREGRPRSFLREASLVVAWPLRRAVPLCAHVYSVSQSQARDCRQPASVQYWRDFWPRECSRKSRGARALSS